VIHLPHFAAWRGRGLANRHRQTGAGELHGTYQAANAGADHDCGFRCHLPEIFLDLTVRIDAQFKVST
jgi:hypothetical protein